MKRLSLALTLVAAPLMAAADTASDTVKALVDAHILPRFETLAHSSQALSQSAAQNCDPASDALRTAFGAAFDAWVSASHLRFGPTETDDRGFALAFWPDSRGATPRTVLALLQSQDPVAASSSDYRAVSIAARGFYALEFLLYDDAIRQAGTPAYRCQLIRTITADIAHTTDVILHDWQTRHAAALVTPTPDGPYKDAQGGLQVLFNSLSTGLQFTAEARLGRPLGRFDRPRPKRAEAWRSGRSAAHVVSSLTALSDLAAHLAPKDTGLADQLEARFDRAIAQTTRLNDPTFASVAAPQTRLKVEIIQQSVDAIRTEIRQTLGPTLGVAAGFNALDGD